MFESEPTLVIQGRVAPKKIHKALRYFIKAGTQPRTRSDLVAMVFDLAATFAGIEGLEDAETNHQALEEMANLGIEWPGEQAQRDVQKTLQFDVLGDLSYEDAMALKAQIQDQRRKGRDMFPSLNKPVERDYDIDQLIPDEEIERWEKEIKEKGDDT